MCLIIVEEITKTNEERWMFHVKQTVEEKGKGLEIIEYNVPQIGSKEVSN